MICACFKHPAHSTAILRRLCLGCSCASRVVTECFDSASCYFVIFMLVRLRVVTADLVPRLWTSLTANFQSSFMDLFHECCKMGLGDLPQIISSMIAAFCAQSCHELHVSTPLLRLIAIIRSPDFLSAHAVPSVATALLHSAICFRSDSALVIACCDAAAAVVHACSSGGPVTGSSGSGAWPARHDGSTVALVWCVAHIFVESQSDTRSGSIACSNLWSKLQRDGIVSAQAYALRSVIQPAGTPPLSITQRLVRVLDTLPIQEQPAEVGDCAIPWSVRHHLSWMIQAERELLLHQLVPLWISRSSFRPLWVLQCAVQSPGEPVRCFPCCSCCCFDELNVSVSGGGSLLGLFCCTSNPSRAPRRFAAHAACCCSLPWALFRIPLKIETLSNFFARWWKVMQMQMLMMTMTYLLVEAPSVTRCVACNCPFFVTIDQHLDATFAEWREVITASTNPSCSRALCRINADDFLAAGNVARCLH